LERRLVLNETVTNITILGSGNIGGMPAKKWAAAGHSVTFGARDVAGPKYHPLLSGISGVALAPIPEAVNRAKMGLRPIYVGNRDQVGVVDGLTRLWLAMAFGQGYWPPPGF
jgi:hypothetical protein